MKKINKIQIASPSIGKEEILAANKDKPFTLKENMIAIGIINIIVLSCSKKIFLTAGSNNQAIEDVLPAIATEKRTASKILLKCCFV